MAIARVIAAAQAAQSPMPETLRGKYQYFTEAPLTNLQAARIPAAIYADAPGYCGLRSPARERRPLPLTAKGYPQQNDSVSVASPSGLGYPKSWLDGCPAKRAARFGSIGSNGSLSAHACLAALPSSGCSPVRLRSDAEAGAVSRSGLEEGDGAGVALDLHDAPEGDANNQPSPSQSPDQSGTASIESKNTRSLNAGAFAIGREE